MTEVYKILEKLNIKNKNIVVAISGGPDSMFLLDALLKFKDKFNYAIIVAHIHHNLRKESDEEALKLEEYCNKKNIRFEMYKIENSNQFLVTQDGYVYIIYAYGNSENTNEMDIIIF